jgi:hypothetical protein
MQHRFTPAPMSFASPCFSSLLRTVKDLPYPIGIRGKHDNCHALGHKICFSGVSRHFHFDFFAFKAIILSALSSENKRITVSVVVPTMYS